MSACDALVGNASAGVAPALRAVDCMAGEATASAFGRLFGSNGALLSALTILLTLYIAFFAVALLTGRSRIGIAALIPRMITLGLVLTFATSWVAYQSVVWNLAVGGPDQIAGVLMGARGSAAQLFADRIDIVFNAIAEAANSGASQGVPAESSGNFTPDNLMWLSALLLLLGTVGILLTARIALAVLLAVGPLFVVFALFSGTRGLFAGWLRGVVLTAVAPLFVVLGGGFMLELVVPVITTLNGADGIDGRAALALFVIAAVHVALMAMVLRVSGAIVVGWDVFGVARTGQADGNRPVAEALQPLRINDQMPLQQTDTQHGPRRSLALVPAYASADNAPPVSHGRLGMTPAATALPNQSPHPAPRALGIGSRFRSVSTLRREMIR